MKQKTNYMSSQNMTDETELSALPIKEKQTNKQQVCCFSWMNTPRPPPLTAAKAIDSHKLTAVSFFTSLSPFLKSCSWFISCQPVQWIYSF